MTPASTIPSATNAPSCRIGGTPVASSERKPAAVLTVVRIIGTPTSRSAEATRAARSSPRRAASCRWPTKCRPSAEPITITNTGTMTVTRSTRIPAANSRPNVHTVPRIAGSIARSASLGLPSVAVKTTTNSANTSGGIVSRNHPSRSNTSANTIPLPAYTASSPSGSDASRTARAAASGSPRGCTTSSAPRPSSASSRPEAGPDRSGGSRGAGSASIASGPSSVPTTGRRSGRNEPTASTASSSRKASRAAATSAMPVRSSNVPPSARVSSTVIGSVAS